MVPPVSGEPRAIVDGLWWLPQCLISGQSPDGLDTHLHTSAFLIVGTDATLLFDSGLPDLQDNLRENLIGILGDRPLDWIVPSHPEYPHSGGLEGLMEYYPNLKIAGDVRDYHLFLDNTEGRLENVARHESIDLGGGFVFTVVEPVIKDLTNTVWGYEHHSRTLFTADGLSYTHYPLTDDDDDVLHVDGECSMLTTELDTIPTPDQAEVVTRAALFWTRLRPTDQEFIQLDSLIEELEIERFAPTHGNVIADIGAVLPIVKRAHQLSYEGGPR